MKHSILITGASGVMGRELVPTLYRGSDAELVLLVHKRRAEDNPRAFLQKHYGLPPGNRLRVITGDVSRPDLGMSLTDRKELRKSLTHVLHAAAETQFGQSLEKARAVNLPETAHILEFARECPELRLFGHVSTAYVSGKRKGRIPENELLKDFASADPGWKRRQLAEPVLVPLENAAQSETETANSGRGRAQRMMKSLQQRGFPKSFDRSNIIHEIPENNDALPEPRVCLRKVVHYCLATQWGRLSA